MGKLTDFWRRTAPFMRKAVCQVAATNLGRMGSAAQSAKPALTAATWPKPWKSRDGGPRAAGAVCSGQVEGPGRRSRT